MHAQPRLKSHYSRVTMKETRAKRRQVYEQSGTYEDTSEARTKRHARGDVRATNKGDTNENPRAKRSQRHTHQESENESESESESENESESESESKGESESESEKQEARMKRQWRRGCWGVTTQESSSGQILRQSPTDATTSRWYLHGG